jgi:hypothetical protein
MGSGLSREAHAPFCGSVGVRFPPRDSLYLPLSQRSTSAPLVRRVGPAVCGVQVATATAKDQDRVLQGLEAKGSHPQQQFAKEGEEPGRETVPQFQSSGQLQSGHRDATESASLAIASPQRFSVGWCVASGQWSRDGFSITAGSSLAKLATAVRHVLLTLDAFLKRWAQRKYKRFKGSALRAWQWFAGLQRRQPSLLPHWPLAPTAGR